MDAKAKGIILKLSDYKEADKLASIFTLEEGIVSAKFVGVKKEKAKMKSVAQPFCLADFVFNQKSGMRTVTSASVIDNFFGITSNYQKTICAYIVLDILKTIIPHENPEQEIFLLTANALKNIEQNDELISTIDFILKFIFFSGVQLEFNCTDIILLDKDTGNFTSQKNLFTQQVDKKVYSTLKQINDGEEPNINQSTLKQSLRLLNSIIYAKFGVEIKSFSFLT